MVPANVEGWIAAPRMPFEVRRQDLLADALKEVAREEFDPTKLLRVRYQLGSLTFSGQSAIDHCGPLWG